MAKISFKGIDEYTAKLAKLESQAVPVIKKTVFEGAAVVADAVRGSIAALPETDQEWGTQARPLTGLRDYEKEAIKAGLGLSKMENDGGYINTKLGFDGYHPDNNGKAVPIPMIARSVESGTSFMQKHPFVRAAVAASKSQAEETMRKTLDSEIEQIMK